MKSPLWRWRDVTRLLILVAVHGIGVDLGHLNGPMKTSENHHSWLEQAMVRSQFLHVITTINKSTRVYAPGCNTWFWHLFSWHFLLSGIIKLRKTWNHQSPWKFAPRGDVPRNHKQGRFSCAVYFIYIYIVYYIM